MNNESIKEFIIDHDDILYIALFNKWNSFCYHTSSVQLLHSSRTLNKCLKERTIEHKLAQVLLHQNMIYSNINQSNYTETFFAIRDSYDKLVDEYIDDYAKDGYSPTYLLLYFLFPAIHEAFPDKFEKILSEINFNAPECPCYNVEYIVKNHPFLKPEYQAEILAMNKRMPGLRHHGTFKGGIMEVFPSLESCDGGHAMFILKTLKANTPTFYVFDDSNCIDEFKRFVSSRNIAKIIIRNIDETSIHQLRKLWGHNTFTVRMNGSWEISNATGTHQKDIEDVNKGFSEIQKHPVEREGIRFIGVQPLERWQMKNLLMNRSMYNYKVQHNSSEQDMAGGSLRSIGSSNESPNAFIFRQRNTLDLRGGNQRFWSSQTSIRGGQAMDAQTNSESSGKTKGLSTGLIISVILNFILIIVIIVDAIFAVKMYEQVKACSPMNDQKA